MLLLAQLHQQLILAGCTLLLLPLGGLLAAWWHMLLSTWSLWSCCWYMRKK